MTLIIRSIANIKIMLPINFELLKSIKIRIKSRTPQFIIITGVDSE